MANVGHFIRLARPYQWTKNLLLFVPAITAHRILEPDTLKPTIVAFFSFSLCASATYAVNDVFDRNADRDHPTKRNRPVASGAIAPASALLFGLVLLAGGLGLSIAYIRFFLPLLLIYLVTTTLYSAYFKQKLLIDVVILALLYTLRVFAGAVAANVELSEWLLIFSMFLFSSLALVKRYSELAHETAPDSPTNARRGYHRGDLPPILCLGMATGVLAVLVMALYVTSDRVRSLYHRPDLLWLICPLLLYWIGRAWLMANRGELRGDPVVFALTDSPSYLVGALSGLIMWVAI